MQFSGKYKWFGYTAVLFVLLGAVVGMSRFTAAAPLTGTTTVVSVDEQGYVGLFPSSQPAISVNGRYVAFTSTYLVSADTTVTDDVYVHDRQTGKTCLGSVASDGMLGNGWSHSPDISGDARYIVFVSVADNLVADDTNGANDVFLHDRQTGQTSRISVNSAGDEVSWDSRTPVISADGRYIAFGSWGDFETGLVTEGYDLFLHDRQTGQVSLVSATYDGSTNLNNANNPFISANGDYTLFWAYGSTFAPGDTNGSADLFLYDRRANELSLVSVNSDGEQGNQDSYAGSVTDDGRYVTFASIANNLVTNDANGFVDIFLHDRQTGDTIRISNGLGGAETNEDSAMPRISADGRYITFSSTASNLVANDINDRDDIFVYDRDTEESSLVSLSTSGVQSNESSFASDVSADGQHIAFQSEADNLVTGDDNGNDDIFVRSLSELTTLTSTLSLNFDTGRPGSFFWVIGVGFPSGPVILDINGWVITDNLPVDDCGNVRFILDTSNADPGFYTVRITVNPSAAVFTSSTAITSATATFTLDAEAPLRPQEGDGVVLQVPTGIAFNHQVFLPSVVH